MADELEEYRAEAKLYRRRAAQFSAIFGVISTVTAVLAAAAPFISNEGQKGLAIAAGCLAAGLTALQASQNYGVKAERYSKGQLLLEKALMAYDLGQIDKKELRFQYDAAQDQLIGSAQVPAAP
jgi:hypothetical protein